MSDNDLIRRGEVREAFSDELYSVFGIDDSFVDNITDSIPDVPQESTWKNKIDGTEWVSHKIDTGVEIHFCTTDNDKAEMVERACHNAVDNVPQEMSAREYGETLMKICASHKGRCYKCELGENKPCAIPDERTIPIVEKWAREHPERSE